MEKQFPEIVIPNGVGTLYWAVLGICTVVQEALSSWQKNIAIWLAKKIKPFICVIN